MFMNDLKRVYRLKTIFKNVGKFVDDLMVLPIYSLHRRPGRSWKEGKLKGNIYRQVEGFICSKAEGNHQKIAEGYLYGRLEEFFIDEEYTVFIIDTMKASENSLYKRQNGIF